MNRQQTFEHFQKLFEEKFSENNSEPLLKNINWIIEHYYDFPVWENIKKNIEDLINEGDLSKLSLYVFKTTQNYRQIIFRR
ncbi:MAG: hypothetical protein PWQ97_1534 [Tepidanaerobacteraceae bacterium]|nr:hypothetical protein [Tepidanaerobacteraceae bacterium]